MRKLIAVFAATLLSVALVGCAGTSDDSDDDAGGGAPDTAVALGPDQGRGGAGSGAAGGDQAIPADLVDEVVTLAEGAVGKDLTADDVVFSACMAEVLVVELGEERAREIVAEGHDAVTQEAMVEVARVSDLASEGDPAAPTGGDDPLVGYSIVCRDVLFGGR